MSRKQSPEINAGSMADIAFLLLIFFLVTTTMNVDSGILRKIAKKNEKQPEIKIKEKNILEVNINKNNELFVDEKIIQLKELKQIAIDFIDNGGGLGTNNTSCDWCTGNKDKTSSDHPSKAFIYIKPANTANYETYITVLNDVNAAYTHLRNKLSAKIYKMNYVRLLEEVKKEGNNKNELLQKIKYIREKYPLLVSDSEISN